MLLLPALLLATAVAATPPAQRVSLEYAEQRDAAGHALHDGEDVSVTGVASVGGNEMRPGVLMFYIQDQSASPYGIALYTSRLKANITAGDVVVARGRIGMYASSIELRPDELSVIGRTKPPSPVDVPAEQLLGPRWSGVLVRTRAVVESVNREEDYADIHLTTSRGPLLAHVTSTHLARFELESITKGVTIEVAGIASEYKRRSSSAVDWEVLPRQPSDVRVVRRSSAALWATLGVAAIAVLLIGAAIVFARPQKIRPEQYP